MGLSQWLGHLAAQAPVPVFAVAGGGGREALQDLRLRPELRLLDTPRPASILLVAGIIPDGLGSTLAHIHDSMAHPRATLAWAVGGPPRPVPGLPHQLPVVGDPVAAVVGTYRDLATGARASEPAILPDVDPAPWRGLGPYGQGGTGMTGGVPYGRPMAELGADPDGLRLDVLPVAVGPLFPRFPVGLVLDVRWAGDLVLEATVADELTDAVDIPARAGLQPFLRALDEPVPIAQIELARAREHLRWLADALRAHGLAALGQRALRLAMTLSPGDGPQVARLGRLVRATQVTRWSTRGVGRLRPEDVAGLGLGPVARAAGVAEDTRQEDPAYRGLGFKPVLGRGGDASARWELRLAEAAQSLWLASRAADRRTGLIGRVESPRGRLESAGGPSQRLLPLLPGVLREVEWGDAVTTLVSLDIDLEESALAGRRTLAEAVA